MNSIVQIGPEVRPGSLTGTVLSRGEAGCLIGAAAVLEAARKEADAIRARATREAAELCEQSRARGLAEGRDEAARHHVKTVIAALSYFQSIQTGFLDTVQTCLRSIIGELPNRERVPLLAKKAMTGFLQQTRLAFRVNPVDLPDVSAALAGLRPLLPEGASVEVTSSEDVPSGGVFIESPLGSIDASLETQLAYLRVYLENGGQG